LLRAIYSDKEVDSEFVIDVLGISVSELETIVKDLVKRGFMKFNSDDEAELTDKRNQLHLFSRSINFLMLSCFADIAYIM
jgi:hypothetical protein